MPDNDAELQVRINELIEELASINAELKTVYFELENVRAQLEALQS